MPAVVDKSRPASLTVPVALSGLPGLSSPAGAKLGTAAASTADKSNTPRHMWPPGRLLSQKIVDLLTRSHSVHGKCHSRAVGPVRTNGRHLSCDVQYGSPMLEARACKADAI